MRCPHCTVEFEAEHSRSLANIRSEDGSQANIWSYRCPACKNLTLQYERIGANDRLRVRRHMVFPVGHGRPPAPPEVAQFDAAVAVDYQEACSVLPLSAKAAAALGRRIVQHLIRSQLSIRKRTLVAEIEEARAEQRLPARILRQLDAVRYIGNNSAHPNEDSAGRILPVDMAEAEWTLDVVVEMFRYLFVDPVREYVRTEELNAKSRTNLELPPLPQKVESSAIDGDQDESMRVTAASGESDAPEAQESSSD